MDFQQHGLHLLQPPPPPPPPAPPIVETKLQLSAGIGHLRGGKLLDKTHITASEICRQACRDLLQVKGLQEEYDDYIFLSRYCPVRPVIQSGPRCGMVALAMASELVNESCTTDEDVFAEAVKKGYSIQGELFSASSLHNLASSFLSCKVKCVKLKRNEANQNLDGGEIVEHLVRGNHILVPYDKDKNHGPCLKKGHKAHWALLTGFLAALKISDMPDCLVSHCERDLEIPTLYIWPADPDKELCDELLAKNITDFLVFAHHGKSKHIANWSLADLLLSNDNLLEAGPERCSDQYVLPPGGVEEGLKSQIVVLERNSHS